ncbi:primase alpha helix C-terminal domain-containing protein [Mammaliicoccus sciuri]|uniref:primase alpha helix C-terminal domain-containing protein n=1 Tax=Mammaliicoccus sciuri TaxID=1296 RepID=UPI002DBBCAC9|nr:primase alpha helix C-terminal domain-containing protein [Mammaliicoccus sciuri]MEB7049790.1 primase alpha helix C-terminal domain-containing protein [Mammaliicoccus sciuri]
MKRLEHDNQVSLTFYKNKYGKAQDGYVYKEFNLTDFYKLLEKPKVIGTDEKEKIMNGLFVSGKVAGDRKDENVEHKNMLILDVDGTPKGYDLFKEVSNRYNNAFAIYTTYKHTSDSGRYRLLIPINRNLTPEQYETLVNLIASNLDIPNIDAGSDQASRCFAMPVVAYESSLYEFKYQDAPIMQITDEQLVKLTPNPNTDSKQYKDAITGDKWKEILKPKGENEGRNNDLTKIVGSMLRRYVDAELTYHLAMLWNESNVVPLSEKEFNTTFKSILKKELQRREHKGAIRVNGY